jgi:hypothetical protein
MTVRPNVCNNSEGNDISGGAQCGLTSSASCQELSSRAAGVMDDTPDALQQLLQ